MLLSRAPEQDDWWFNDANTGRYNVQFMLTVGLTIGTGTSGPFWTLLLVCDAARRQLHAARRRQLRIARRVRRRRRACVCLIAAARDDPLLWIVRVLLEVQLA